MTGDIDGAVEELIRITIVEALMDKGRRLEPSERVAAILTPIVLKLLNDPLITKWLDLAIYRRTIGRKCS